MKPRESPKHEGATVTRRHSHGSRYTERKRLETLPDNIPGLKFGLEIGHGHFSHVYSGIYHETTHVAIKVIERGSEQLVTTEIQLLRALRNCPHVVQLLEVIVEPQFILIFEEVISINKDLLFEYLTPAVLRMILRSVLEALVAAHARQIVHRDIKLGNILVTLDLTNAVLIDWGCGSLIGDSMTSSAGSRSIRSPEMLIGYQNYRTAGDIWSCGVLILSILSAGFVPWRSLKSVEAFTKMSHYFGGRNLRTLAAKCKLSFPKVEAVNWTEEPDQSLESGFHAKLSGLCDPHLVNLMKTCLVVDFEARPSASGLLEHPYFRTSTP
jgi:serine/threonine protein kinase